MAARVLSQRRFLTPLATMALGAVAFAPTLALAEEPADFKRKPMYDEVETPSSNPAPSPLSKILTRASAEAQEEEDDDKHKPKGPTPTDRLAVQIGHARLFLYRHALSAEKALNDTMDSAFNLEQSFTNTIASLAPSRETGEKLMPGAIYVLVAAMAGSILTRNRNIVLRATAPVALGVGAGWVVLPVTMRNVADLSWKYEQRFPAVAESHVKIRDGLKKGVSFARVHSQLGVRYVDDKVTDAREAVEDWVKKGK